MDDETVADLKKMVCIGKPTIKQMEELGKLTARRLMMWTQQQVQNLKEGWKAARRRLASGFVSFMLWDQDVSRQVDVVISKQE